MPKCKACGQDLPLSNEQELKRYFDLWYIHYPRKIGKKDAYKAFKKVSPNKEEFQQMVKVLKYQTSIKWADEDDKFIPYPATYLNRGFYDEEIKTNSEGNDSGPMVYIEKK